jgi:hypothetical protein
MTASARNSTITGFIISVNEPATYSQHAILCYKCWWLAKVVVVRVDGIGATLT